MSDDDKTYYNFNASAFSSAEMSEDNRILTFTDYNNYVDRTTWETKDADDPEDEFGYSLWNPNELPEKKNTEYLIHLSLHILIPTFTSVKKMLVESIVTNTLLMKHSNILALVF